MNRTLLTHARSSADLRQEIETLFFHHPTETKVSNHDIRIFSLCAEEQVLRLQICIRNVNIRTMNLMKKLRTTMDNTTAMDVGH